MRKIRMSGSVGASGEQSPEATRPTWQALYLRGFPQWCISYPLCNVSGL